MINLGTSEIVIHNICFENIENRLYVDGFSVLFINLLAVQKDWLLLISYFSLPPSCNLK